MSQKKAIIIGAGPAGLTAAHELLERTGITPIIFETSSDIGGISKTISHHGNRIDLGGHRFFSKSDRIMAWWLKMMPLQGAPSRDDIALARRQPFSTAAGAPDPQKSDRVLLVRNRLSRIFFLRRFFDYPVTLNWNTLRGLGWLRIVRITLSYIRIRLFPVRPVKSLEDFFVNRFGRELYLTFFKDYTEKVWGVPCDKIKPEWGAQRVKGLSITKAILHALKKSFSRRPPESIEQKKTETSLIERFYYPKFGPGQMWETTARVIAKKKGEIHLRHTVIGIETRRDRVVAIRVRDEKSGRTRTVRGDYFFSTMAVKDLIGAMGDSVPKPVRKIAAGLMYRNFVTVGLLLKKFKIKNDTPIRTVNDIIPDCWIYIQERDVKLGRLQIFNNWSPYMVKDENTVWIGLEYFCDDNDGIWIQPDDRMAQLAVSELARIGIIDTTDVLDWVVIRMPKTYPAYFGTYDRFSDIRQFCDRFPNLFLIGRNGQHRYNNMDHSMLTAMTAVDNIVNGVAEKDNIWAVNTEEEYHEEKKTSTDRA